MSGDTTNMIAWLEPQHADLVGRIAARSAISLVGIGSPDASTHGGLATALNTPVIPDLRQAAQQDDIDVIWLACGRGIGTDEMRELSNRNGLTICSEPRVLGLEGPLDGSTVASFPRFVPLMRRTPGYLAARSALDDFGQVQTLSLCFRSGPSDGSLHARLFDAMDFVTHLLGDVELIQAAMHEVSAADALAGGTPTATGHLNAVVQAVDGRCASLLISNRTGPWRRTATLLGGSGVLEIDDLECIWATPEGTETEVPSVSAMPSGDDHALDATDLMALQIDRLCAGLDTDVKEPPPANAVVLALCESALLSCRTGQAESPATLIRMYQSP